MQLEIPFGQGEVYQVTPRAGVMVPMPWILNHAVSSTDCGGLGSADDWLRMMAEKSDDSLAALIPAVEDVGQLDPTVLLDYGDGRVSISNGHHRLVLNILRGEDWHRVYFEDPHSWNDEAWWKSTEHEGQEFNYTPDHMLARMLRDSLDPFYGEFGCECEDCLAEAA